MMRQRSWARWIKRHERLWLTVGVWLSSCLLRGLLVTLRPVYVQKQFEQRVCKRNTPFLLACWHGRALYFMRLYRHRSFTLLVSHSRDGEFLSRILPRFGIHTVRGSTCHRGMRGLLQMVRNVRQGYGGAFTPDGPRGPRYHVRPGIVAVAKKTGAPILPATYSAQWKRVLQSWDQFVVPLPFSRVVVVYGEPIYVPADASAATFQAKRHEVEVSLQRITDIADHYFSPEG
jgi:lysophospholipid acyltransferase (LPLAT)-like uncharacterized protein